MNSLPFCQVLEFTSISRIFLVFSPLFLILCHFLLFLCYFINTPPSGILSEVNSFMTFWPVASPYSYSHARPDEVLLSMLLRSSSITVFVKLYFNCLLNNSTLHYTVSSMRKNFMHSAYCHILLNYIRLIKIP